MIILPIYIGALIIFILSLVRVIPLIKGNELSVILVAIGIAIPVILLFALGTNWVLKGKLHHYAPIFQFPFLLVYVPALIYLVLKLILPTESLNLIRPIVMVALTSGALLIIPALMYGTRVLGKMGVKFYY